jgi:sigma-B regulation protein RsbU (phosphoserine phosphatase)
MPTVAIIATVLFLVWIAIRKAGFYQEHEIFTIFGFAIWCFGVATVAYYGLKALRWVKRRLLWRVRRRLLITYLFVGVTPIVLLTLLGALAWFAVSNGAMARVITAQLSGSERDVVAGARAIAESYSNHPRMDDRAAKQWLDEKVKILEKGMPGARITLWREHSPSKAKQNGAATNPLVSASNDTLESRSFGPEGDIWESELPQWLEGQEEWSGIAFIPPSTNVESPFSTPYFRALVRGKENDLPFAVLLTYPINRAYVTRLTDTTGLTVSPYFRQTRNSRITIGKQGRKDLAQIEGGTAKQTEANLDLRVDQAGQPIKPGVSSPVLLTSTNWLTGQPEETLAFFFAWSWAAASKHLLDGGVISNLFQKMLWATGITFLVFELFALLSAGWMTRAVTGTVHKLHRATKFINRGDFSHRVIVRSHDQLGELAEAFNEMSSNIESLLKERVERERLQREVEIAAEVQSQLFPSEVPPLSSVELSAECRAASGVAGDYYDYVEISHGLVAIALGDVSGKGISASLVMSNLQAALRAQSSMIAERLKESRQFAGVGMGFDEIDSAMASAVAIDPHCSVERIVGSINHQLCRSTGANRFATLFVGLYDDRTRTLCYTNAGHNPPMLVRADGSIERLTTGGMMVGAFDWAQYDQAAVQLRSGDALVIYSDGLTEAERVTGEEFGDNRLSDLVVANRKLPADQLCQAIFSEVERWSDSEERVDDQTLVIVKAIP